MDTSPDGDESPGLTLPVTFEDICNMYDNYYPGNKLNVTYKSALMKLFNNGIYHKNIKDPVRLWFIGLYNYKIGKYTDAIEFINLAINRGFPRKYTLLLQAKSYYQCGDTENAYKYYNYARHELEDYPYKAECLGSYYYECEDYELAIKYLLPITEDEYTDEYLVRLADSFENIGDIENAKKYYHEAFDTYCTSDVLYDVAHFYYRTVKNYELAIKYHKQNIELFNCAKSYNELGIIYDEIYEDYAQADYYYKLAVELDHEYISITNYAIFLQFQNRLTQSLYYYLMYMELYNITPLEEINKNDYTDYIETYNTAICNIILICIQIKRINIAQYAIKIADSKNLITSGCVPTIQHYTTGNYQTSISCSIECMNKFNCIKCSYMLCYSLIAISTNTAPDATPAYDTNQVITNIWSFLKKNEAPHILDLLNNNWTASLRNEIIKRLGIYTTDHNYLNIKLANNAKLDICNICMSGEPVNCIPINWCMHYVCVDCYMKLYKGPCPYCRLS